MCQCPSPIEINFTGRLFGSVGRKPWLSLPSSLFPIRHFLRDRPFSFGPQSVSGVAEKRIFGALAPHGRITPDERNERCRGCRALRHRARKPNHPLSNLVGTRRISLPRMKPESGPGRRSGPESGPLHLVAHPHIYIHLTVLAVLLHPPCSVLRAPCASHFILPASSSCFASCFTPRNLAPRRFTADARHRSEVGGV